METTMKRTLATLTFCLLVLVATGFPFDKKGGSAAGGASKEKRVQYAAWDDVNVIAHGLLQLGQGLKEHVDRTKVQMRDISTKLKLFNRTVTDLGKESQKLRAEGEAAKSRARELEDREGQLLNITAELREKAEEMQLERRAMSARMSRLEEMLPGAEAGAGNGSDARHIQVGRRSSRSCSGRRQNQLGRERVRLNNAKTGPQMGPVTLSRSAACRWASGGVGFGYQACVRSVEYVRASIKGWETTRAALWVFGVTRVVGTRCEGCQPASPSDGLGKPAAERLHGYITAPGSVQKDNCWSLKRGNVSGTRIRVDRLLGAEQLGGTKFA